jgi:hypothetical protein
VKQQTTALNGVLARGNEDKAFVTRLWDEASMAWMTEVMAFAHRR